MPMPRILTTQQVCRLTGVSYPALCSMLRDGHLEPPAKLASGAYIWLPGDVARLHRARQAIRQRTSAPEPEPVPA